MEIEQPTLKPSLFNFIIYTQETRRVDYFQEIINTVTEKFPCRILFIKGDMSSEEEKFQTEVSTILGGGKGELTIPCDFIVIEASGNQLKKVPFAILQYLVPDLPIYFLWGQDPADDNEILTQLEKFSSRLIVDSECTDNLPQFSQKMLKKIKNLHCDIIDMNWARCQGWRNVIAKTFDSEDKIEQLRYAKSIQITYNLKSTSCFYHHEIQALYLQAWLATQLNWKFRNLETHERMNRFQYATSKQDVVVDLLPRTDDQLPPGTLLSFEVTSHDDHYYILSCHSDAPRQVKVYVSSKEICELPYVLTLSNRNQGIGFIKELLYAPVSKHYLDMLRTIAHHHLAIALEKEGLSHYNPSDVKAEF